MRKVDLCVFFFFSSRRRHTRFDCDWSSDVCSSDLDANSEQPKQHGKANRGENRPAHSAAAPTYSHSVVLVRCFFSACNNYDAHECANDPRDSYGAQAFTRHPGEQKRQSGVAGRERRHHRHFSNLKGAVESQSGRGVEESSQKTPSPRLPPGTVREMPPAAQNWQKNSQEEEPNQLHIKHRTESANAMRSKTRNEIRAAPSQRCQQAQQNSHDELGGLAFLYFKAEDCHDLLEILPDFALRRRIAQQIRGVIGGQKFSSAKFKPLAAKLRN